MSRKIDRNMNYLEKKGVCVKINSQNGQIGMWVASRNMLIY